MAEHHLTFCRICTAYCGLVVETDGDEIVAVRGDREHPESAGYTCPKGRAIGIHHARADRLDYPSIGGDRVSWDVLTDDLGARLAALVGEYGPQSVGMYWATGGGTDKAGLLAANRLFTQLGTKQRYSGMTVDVAPALFAAELVTGYAWDVTPYWNPEADSPAVTIVIGQNPVVSHGYLTILTDPVRRIRDYQRRGGELWVIDPRHSETAALADHHLAPLPGTDSLVLAWLVRELLEDGADEAELRDCTDPADVERLRRALAPFTGDVVAARCDIAPAELEALLATVRRAGRVACMTGTGVTFGRQPVVTEWLRWALLIVTGSIDRPDGMPCVAPYFNQPDHRTTWDPAPPEGRREPGPPSRPELHRWFGEYPATAMVSEIEAGHLRALVVHGGNPLAAFPDTERTREALRSLEVLAVVDVTTNELTELATHVIASASMLERADLATTRERGCHTPALVPLGADRRPAWWVYAQVARRMGIDVLDGLHPDACDDDRVLRMLTAHDPDRFDAVHAAGPRGTADPVPVGWVRERALAGGRWRLAPQLVLERLPDLLEPRREGALTYVNRRQVRAVNSVHYQRPQDARIDQPDILLHPDDALRHGVEDGRRVRLRNETGSLEGTARVDEHVRRGVVSVPNGWAEVNVNHLVSRVTNVDDLTGQPRISCVGVDVEVVDEAVDEAIVL